eukprot:scaffold53394_cov27-Tisochrysis_lutea.AAC.1
MERAWFVLRSRFQQYDEPAVLTRFRRARGRSDRHACPITSGSGLHTSLATRRPVPIAAPQSTP